MTPKEAKAHKQAAKLSKTEGTQFVVYVYDEGYDVYTAAQALLWMQIVILEACYINGVLMTSPAAELTRFACASREAA